MLNKLPGVCIYNIWFYFLFRFNFVMCRILLKHPLFWGYTISKNVIDEEIKIFGAISNSCLNWCITFRTNALGKGQETTFLLLPDEWEIASRLHVLAFPYKYETDDFFNLKLCPNNRIFIQYLFQEVRVFHIY